MSPRSRHQAAFHLAQVLDDQLGKRADRKVAAERAEIAVVTDVDPVVVHLQRSDVTLREDLLEWSAACSPDQLAEDDELVVIVAGEDFLAISPLTDSDAARTRGGPLVRQAALDDEIAARQAGDEAVPVPHGHLTWNGSKATTTNTHYTFATLGTGQPRVDWADSGMIVDAAAGQITVPKKGLYLVTAQVSFAPNDAEGVRTVNVRTFGGAVGEVASGTNGTVGSANSSVASASDFWPLNAGDGFEVTIYSNFPGSTLTKVMLGVAYIGPTVETK